MITAVFSDLLHIEDTFLNVKISGKDNKINDISVKRRMGKLEWESGFLIWGMLSFSDTV